MKLFYLSLLNQMNEAAAFSPEVNKSRWQCWLWTSGSPARRITFFSPLLSIQHFLLPLCSGQLCGSYCHSQKKILHEPRKCNLLKKHFKGAYYHHWQKLIIENMDGLFYFWQHFTQIYHIYMRKYSLKFFSYEKYICLGPRRMVSSAQIQPLFSFDIPFTDFSKLFFLKTTIAVLVTATCYKCLTD